jgi:hypothetical protein
MVALKCKNVNFARMLVKPHSNTSQTFDIKEFQSAGAEPSVGFCRLQK